MGEGYKIPLLDQQLSLPLLLVNHQEALGTSSCLRLDDLKISTTLLANIFLSSDILNYPLRTFEKHTNIAISGRLAIFSLPGFF